MEGIDFNYITVVNCENGILNITPPPKIKPATSTIELQSVLQFGEYNKYVEHFVKELLKNFTLEELTILSNNLTNLKIKTYLPFFRKKALAIYNIMNNTIILYQSKYEDCIYHELYHSSNSLFNQTTVYSGLCQQSLINQACIGEGLTEGYTSLMDHKYFNTDGNDYYILRHFSYKLQSIIGEKKMQEMYFNADLYRLIKELSKYDSLDNVIAFINSFDCLHKYTGNRKRSSQKDKMYITESLDIIYRSLIKWYIKKQKKLYVSGEIDEATMINEILKYTRLLSGNIEIEGNNYQILEVSDIQNIFNNNLSCSKQGIKILSWKSPLN